MPPLRPGDRVRNTLPLFTRGSSGARIPTGTKGVVVNVYAEAYNVRFDTDPQQDALASATELELAW